MRLAGKILAGFLAGACAFLGFNSVSLGKPLSKMMRLWEVESRDTGGTLLFSDSPEYVRRDGILYADTVRGDARVLFYHLNDTNDLKKVAVVVESTGRSGATINITRGGMSRPSASYLNVGRATQREYFERRFLETISLRRGEKRVLMPEMNKMVLYPGQLIYGVYDFHANQDVKVSVIMYPANVDPIAFLNIAKVLPKDEQRLRGTFKGMNRILNSRRPYNPSRDGIVYFPIGDDKHDRYMHGIDATDGSKVKNYGNYGVLYRINIPTVGGHTMKYFLSPLGGVYAGAMTAHTKGRTNLLMTPTDRTYFGDLTPPEAPSVADAREKGLAIFNDAMELTDLGTYNSGSAVSFEYSPPGASNLPVNIIMMPAEN